MTIATIALTRRGAAALGFAALLLAAPTALAQKAAGKPSVDECAAATSAVRGSARETPGAPAWWTAARCGPAGASALAGILSALVQETDAERIATVEGVLRTVRDGYLFAAERQLASTGWASGPARALALRLMLAEHNPAIIVMSVAPTLDAVQPCHTQSVALPPQTQGAPLPGDYLAQAAQTARAIVSDVGAPYEARATARCVGGVFDAFVPVPIQPASLQLAYVCGNTFRVHNPNGDWADVTYAVEGTDDTGDLSVPPQGDATFLTDASGSTQLYYNEGHDAPLGTLVQTVANAGTACAQRVRKR